MTECKQLGKTVYGRSCSQNFGMSPPFNLYAYQMTNCVLIRGKGIEMQN